MGTVPASTAIALVLARAPTASKATIMVATKNRLSTFTFLVFINIYLLYWIRPL
jgi:hypothetical protein